MKRVIGNPGYSLSPLNFNESLCMCSLSELRNVHFSSGWTLTGKEWTVLDLRQEKKKKKRYAWGLCFFCLPMVMDA
jgi:hypothetical protein